MGTIGKKQGKAEYFVPMVPIAIILLYFHIKREPI